jgi:hypothetical protein
MNSYADKTLNNKSGAVPNAAPLKRHSNESRETVNNNPQVMVIQRGGDYSGTGSDGSYKQGWFDWTKEKLHGAAIGAANYVRGHPAALASTGVEMATGSVDALALRTALNELHAAMSGMGNDLSHGDIWSIVDRCVDASAAVIRGGASIHSVTHAWGHATGIPLVGDAAWYGAANVRDKLKKAIHPHMLKAIEHKKKIGKLA